MSHGLLYYKLTMNQYNITSSNVEKYSQNGAILEIWNDQGQQTKEFSKENIKTSH